MYLEASVVEEIAEAARLLDPQSHEIVVVLLAEHSGVAADAVCAVLKESGVRFIGAVFPKIVHGEQASDRGCILMKLPASQAPTVITGLDSTGWEASQLPNPREVSADGKMLFVLVDGLTSNIASFLEGLYERFGGDVSYLGGGAGSLSLKQAPCVLTPEGTLQDAAIVAVIDAPVTLGVRHGWSRLHGPLVASRTTKNVIHELNWRNALEVYREVVEAIVGDPINQENFFSISKGFPFGMSKDGCEDIVRDPIAADEEGNLICVGEVPAHSILHILSGNREDLIEAAKQAGADCRGEDADSSKHLVIDCISRSLFLEDEFPAELKALSAESGLSSSGQVLEGALTLGEISSVGDGYLEFLNKTIVFARFNQ